MSKPAPPQPKPPLPRYEWITIFKDPAGGFRFAVCEAGIDQDGNLDESEVVLVSPRYPMRIEVEEKFRIWVADHLMREDADE